MSRRAPALFIVVGSLTVLLDFIAYRSLVWIGFFSVALAKAGGFLLGTVFAYFANRRWTFAPPTAEQAHAPGSGWRFIWLYAVTLGTNVALNGLFLAALDSASTEMPVAMPVAFVMATGVSAILNFFGLKLFVFKAATVVQTR
ncbi:MAG: putative flippase GtrA [Janthinobacterium sp.]|jgi:putative flippase GtrA